MVDPLLRRPLTLRQHGVGVELVPGEGVFSAPAIDPGTAFLLRWLAVDPAVERAATVLDLGCGYGPLGLWLAAARADRHVAAVDRDALAVECTALGAAGNGLGDRVSTTASLGYDDVPGGARFDLIVSNVPAKVGPAALRHLLLDAWFRLEPGGAVAVVVVERLAAAVGGMLEGEAAVEILDRHANKHYATWTYRFAGEPAGADPRAGFDRGVYRRGGGRFSVGRVAWDAATSYTVPEFDTLSHGTALAVETLAAAPPSGPVGVVGVGQGHVALALRAIGGGDTTLRLVDRDLLALRTAAANLGGAGVELAHTARPDLTGCASAVAALPDKQPVATTTELLGGALATLPAGAPVVVHGRAPDVGRVLDLLGRRGHRLPVADRRVRSGYAAVRVTVAEPSRFTVTPPP